jgi:transcription elongation factor Elf1
MTYVDLKYINILSGQLPLFKRKSNNLFNFRCPFCGDSQKNKTKARGYVYQVESKYSYKCHNCGVTSSIGNLIKHVDVSLFKEYRMESFVNKDRVIQEKPKEITFSKRKYHFNTPLKALKKISQLQYNHPAKEYVQKRKIPNEYHRKLYYAPYFAKFVNSIIPRKLSEDNDEPRLLIPFFDEYENLIGFQGRSFSKNSIRYITIMIEEDKPKIFGLDEVDWTKRVYALEGPIDSMFIDNAIAMIGADGGAYINSKKKQDIVLVFDNEPKSSMIQKKLSRLIDEGFSVCIWPNYLQYKDINDMILSGMTKVEILNIINVNTFQDLNAKMKLVEWSKL